MSFVSFLHWLDFVGLCGTFSVGFDGVINSLLDNGSFDIIDSKHEFEDVSQSLLWFVFQLLEFQEEDWNILSLLNFKNVVKEILLPLDLLFNMRLPKLWVLFGKIMIKLFEMAICLTHMHHRNNACEWIPHQHDDLVH